MSAGLVSRGRRGGVHPGPLHEAFLVLRAQAVGLHPTFIPLVLIVMNIVYAAAAAPAGALSDRMDRRAVPAVGLGILILADLALAFLRRSAASCSGSRSG